MRASVVSPSRMPAMLAMAMLLALTVTYPASADEPSSGIAADALGRLEAEGPNDEGSGHGMDAGPDSDAGSLVALSASRFDQDLPLQALSEGGSVPLVAEALAGEPTRFVNQAVALDSGEPVIGSFIVDGMTFAVTGEEEVELAAVGNRVLAVDAASGSASGFSETKELGLADGVDSSEDEDAPDLPALAVPGSVEHGGRAYTVISVGARALAGCDVDAVVLPETVEAVDEAAFRGSSVASVEVAEGNPYVASYEGVLYDADLTSLLLIPEGKEGVVRIPSNTSMVPPSAFSHCAGVESIEVDAGNETLASRDGSLYDASGAMLSSVATSRASRGTWILEFWSYDGSRKFGEITGIDLDGTVTLPGYYTDSSMPGYAPVGFSSVRNADKATYKPKETISCPSPNATSGYRHYLFQVMRPLYKVTYWDSTGKVKLGTDENVIFGEPYTMRPNPGLAAPTGYFASGWTGAAGNPWHNYRFGHEVTGFTDDQTPGGEWYQYLCFTPIPLTVTYKSADGSKVLSTDPDFRYGMGRALAAKPTSGVTPGYEAVGWSTSKGQATASYAFGSSQAFSEASGSVTLYLAEKGRTIRTNWDPNGGTIDGSTQVHYRERTYALGVGLADSGWEIWRGSTRIARVGYSFRGWCTERSGSLATEVTGHTALPTSEATYYAWWLPVSYTISYQLGGGTLSGQKDSYTIETADFTLPAPVRAGYEFTGWSVTGKQGGEVTTSGTKTVVKKGTYGNLTATAQWRRVTYSIAYELSGGSVSGQPTSYTIETADFSLPVPVRPGYKFTGWTVTGKQGGEVATSGTTTTVKKGTYGNLTATAIWAENAWILEFWSNDGARKLGELSGIDLEGQATLPGYFDDSAMANYQPIGYSSVRNATSAAFKPGDRMGCPASGASNGYRHYLYQVMSPVYTYTYWDSAGTTVLFQDRVLWGEELVLRGDPGHGAPTGYHAAGWTTIKGGIRTDYGYGQRVVAGTEDRKPNEWFLWNCFSPDPITVTYEDRTGSKVLAVDPGFEYDQPRALAGKPSDGLSPGYEAVGWSNEREDPVADYGFGSTQRFREVSGAKALYLAEEPLEYGVAYEVGGGELSAGARTSYTVEDGFDLPVPTRYGYQFEGWNVKGAAADGTLGEVQGAGVEDVAVEGGGKMTRVKVGTYGDLACTARWTLRYDLDVPVRDPDNVTFEADSLTGQVRVAPGTSAEGSILSYMAEPVSLDSLACEGLDSAGDVAPAGQAPELEAIFGPGSAAKVRFTATLGEGDGALTAKLSPGDRPASLAALSIPAATSAADPGRLPVTYGLELDADLPIPPVRDAAPVARLTYTVSLPRPSA